FARGHFVGNTQKEKDHRDDEDHVAPRAKTVVVAVVGFSRVMVVVMVVMAMVVLVMMVVLAVLVVVVMTMVVLMVMVVVVRLGGVVSGGYHRQKPNDHQYRQGNAPRQHRPMEGRFQHDVDHVQFRRGRRGRVGALPPQHKAYGGDGGGNPNRAKLLQVIVAVIFIVNVSHVRKPLPL